MRYLKSPHAKLAIVGPEDLQARLKVIPGTYFARGSWLIPNHAFPAISRILTEWNEKYPGEPGTIQHFSWVVPPPERLEWDTVLARLQATGTIRPEVISGEPLPDGSRVQPKNYQKAGVCFAVARSGALLQWGTGAGKTLGSILVATTRKAPLVIVTRAPARFQWARELRRFTRLNPYILKGAEATAQDIAKTSKTIEKSQGRIEKLEGQQKEATGRKLIRVNEDLERSQRHLRKLEARLIRLRDTPDRYLSTVENPAFIVGWEALTDWVDWLSSAVPRAFVIFDESHRAKSHQRFQREDLLPLDPESPTYAQDLRAQNDRVKSAHGFIKVDPDTGLRFAITPRENISSAAGRLSRIASGRLLTTATPVKNRLSDFWSQLDLIEPDAWGTASAWTTRYCAPRIGYGGSRDISGMSNVEELAERLKFVIHAVTTAETHKELPAKTRMSYYISVEDQEDPPSSVLREAREAIQAGATALLEHRLYAASLRKRGAALELMEERVESGQKIVVFTARRRDCEELAAAARKKLPGTPIWWGHGEMGDVDRQAVVDSYMASPGPAVLIGTGAAFGESLNLQDTDTALFVMLPYTPGELRQWEGRFHRHGMERPVTVIYLIAERTVDEHVADILINKLPAIEDVVQDADLAESRSALAGIEDKEALASSILDKISDMSDDYLDDD